MFSRDGDTVFLDRQLFGEMIFDLKGLMLSKAREPIDVEAPARNRGIYWRVDLRVVKRIKYKL